MRIQVQCPHCDKALKVNEELSGRKVKCPACQTKFVINLESKSPPPVPTVPDVKRTDVVTNRPDDKSSLGQSTAPVSKSRQTVIAVTIVALVATSLFSILTLLIFSMKSKSPATEEPFASVNEELPEDSPTTAVDEQSLIANTTPDEATIENETGKEAAPVVTPAEINESAKERPRPKEIVFPMVRKFNHPSQLLTLPGQGFVVQRLIAKADDNDIFLMVDFFVNDFGVNGKTPKLLERGTFSFRSRSKDWPALNPKTLSFRFNGRTMDLKTERDHEMIVAVFSLADFETFLSATTIDVQIEDRKFVLEKRHLEALRDLASRLPEGPTSNKNFVVKHQDDTPPVEESQRVVFPHPGTPEPRFELTRDRKPSEGTILYQLNTLLKGEIQIYLSHATDIRDDLPDDTVILGFSEFFLSVNWRLANPKAVTFLVDGDPKTFELEREGEFLFATLNLHELEALSNTKSCIITIGTEQMSLLDHSLLAIRHFCSHIPSGKTKSGRFEVVHEGEVITEQHVEENHKPQFGPPKPILTKKEKELLAKTSKSNLQVAKKLLNKDPAKARKMLEKIVADDPDSFSGRQAKDILLFTPWPTK